MLVQENNGELFKLSPNSTLKQVPPHLFHSAGCFAIPKLCRKIFLYEDIELDGQFVLWNVDVCWIFSIFG